MNYGDGDGCIRGLLLHPPSLAYPCVSCCTMQQTVKTIWLLACVMINLYINTILLLSQVVICHISTERIRGHIVPATRDQNKWHTEKASTQSTEKHIHFIEELKITDSDTGSRLRFMSVESWTYCMSRNISDCQLTQCLIWAKIRVFCVTWAMLTTTSTAKESHSWKQNLTLKWSKWQTRLASSCTHRSCNVLLPTWQASKQATERANKTKCSVWREQRVVFQVEGV